MKSLEDPYAYGPKVWDKIAAETGIDRHAVKHLIFCFLYGGPIVHVCKTCSLEIMQINDIRNCFDDIMQGRIPV